jgi:hypothetical protein
LDFAPADTEAATSVFCRDAGSSNARDIHNLGATSAIVDGAAPRWLSFSSFFVVWAAALETTPYFARRVVRT